MDLTDPTAPFLFSPEIMQSLETRERIDHQYTLENLVADKRAAIRILAAQPGWDVKAIAETVNVAWRTVAAVIDDDQVEIANFKGRLPRKLQRLLWELIEHIHANLGKLPVENASQLVKTLYEVYCNEEGRASTITEKHVIEAKVAAPFADGWATSRTKL